MKKVFIYRGIKVLEQSWIHSEKRQLPPLVILPGHLHTEAILKDFIQTISRYCSVIVVELPGWGENTSHALNDVENADILAKFFEDRGLRGANLIAFGDATACAYYFAYVYPRWLNKLVLHGVAARLRDSVRTLFRGNIDALENTDAQRFMTGMLSAVLNHSKRQNIPNYASSKEALYRTLAPDVLAPEAIAGVQKLERYLTRDDLPDGVKVPTLLVAGEYDPFTSVHDHFLVARRCERAQLAVLSGCDHFAILQRPREFLLATLSYLVKGSVSAMETLRVHDGDEIPGYLRQIYPRVHLDEIGFIAGRSGTPIPINIKDMNIYGCQLFTLFSKHRSFKEERLVLKLTTPDVEDFKLDLSFFSQNRGTFKAVFHHPNLDVLESLESVLNRLHLNRAKKHSLLSA